MINLKILEFQKKGISLSKDWKNPHFKSEYVTLNEVLWKVKKPLNDLWVIIVQLPQETGLKTQLIDTEDNTYIECFMPYVECTTAQKLWSNNTYNRRYSLITLLWLEDDDDDWNKASEKKEVKEWKQLATINIVDARLKKVDEKASNEEPYPTQPQLIAKLLEKYELNEQLLEHINKFYSILVF